MMNLEAKADRPPAMRGTSPTGCGHLRTPASNLGIPLAALVLLLVFGGAVARANDIYIAQSAAGSQDGSSCANAHAYSFFNAAANWGSASVQIGPGTTVHLCGTITDVVNGTLLTAQGSGSSGRPVTIAFESGASLQSPAENTFIAGNGKSYFIIDGGFTCGWINGARTACNGLIQNTLNGYPGTACPGGTCAYQVQTQVINGFYSNLELRNLAIGPVYVHGGTGDVVFSSPGPKCLDFTSAGGTINIHNTVMHDAGWCLNGGGNSITLAYTEIYNCDHAIGMGQYSDMPNTWTGITIHDNYIHDPGTWDQSNNAFHHDGIHLFSYCATTGAYCPETQITGVNIYNNRFGGNWGNNNTANIFFESNIANANIFNNVSIATLGKLNNGFWNGYGQNVNFLNNTVLGLASAQAGNKWSIFTGPGIVVENNVWTDGGMISTNGPWPGTGCPYAIPSANGGGTQACVNLSYTLKTNAYLAATEFGNGFGYYGCIAAACTGNGFLNFNTGGFSLFEASAPETGGIFRASLEPNGTWLNANTGAALPGSPTIATGTNLSALCAENGGPLPSALCLDIVGNQRPSGGAWDIGAYQSNSAPTLNPPTSLTVSVR